VNRLINVPVKQIHQGKRFRLDPGDIEGLAANIRENGLLQPIGVDKHFNLVFGARRLLACVDGLGWTEIPAVVVDLESILIGEYSENQFRKDFTPSERAAIGEAIEASLPKRQGGDRRSSSANAEVELKGNSVDIAAKRAGFRSAETFERAKKVAERGAPELIEAMDKGEVSINAAAKIASQPKDEQKRIVQLPADKRASTVRDIRESKADREKDEARSRDLRLFIGLYNAVNFIAGLTETPQDTWAGLGRVSVAHKIGEPVERALNFLDRLRREHPNATKRPVRVS
jgi:ParB family chromosome partitioning protein